jgi:hypothetical protein
VTCNKQEIIRQFRVLISITTLDCLRALFQNDLSAFGAVNPGPLCPNTMRMEKVPPERQPCRRHYNLANRSHHLPPQTTTKAIHDSDTVLPKLVSVSLTKSRARRAGATSTGIRNAVLRWASRIRCESVFKGRSAGEDSNCFQT